jgi:hypothetical protein
VKINKKLRAKAVLRRLKILEKIGKSISPFEGMGRDIENYNQMEYWNDRYYELTGKYY